jgi:sugar/nucleoside kinase (ribokinase family)
MLTCCGGIRIDTVITVEGTARINEMGGNAIFSAGGARLWRDDVAILGRIGDNFPQQWLRDLAARGFDVRGIRNIGGIQDHRTFYAYIDRDTRVDTDPAFHFARIGAPLPPELADYTSSTRGQDNLDAYEPLTVTPEDLEALPVASLTALHIAPGSILTQRNLPPAARARGAACVSVDPSERLVKPEMQSHLEDVLARIDVFLPSDMEVASFFRDDPAMAGDPAAAARWFAARGPRVVVIKRGSRGAYVYAHEHDRAWHVPALAVDVVDVTGAGDSFCGGFMAVYSRTTDPLEAAVCGAATASFTIEDYGAARLLTATRRDALDRAASIRAGVVPE